MKKNLFYYLKYYKDLNPNLLPMDTKLIESALQLMGKTMEDMEEYEENEIV